MSNDPLTITLDEVADLLRGLGLDPVDPNRLRSVHMEGGTIEVVRYRTNEDGRQVVVGNEVLTETVLIKVVRA